MHLSRLTLFLLMVGMSLCMGLGFWQLHRAEEKETLLTQYQAAQQKKPQSWRVGLALPQQYQRIQVKGHDGEPLFLLDNQYYQHQWGYHVLTPFYLNQDTIVMVDRGWVLGDPRRERLPDVDIPLHELQIAGVVYTATRNRWISEGTVEKMRSDVWVLAQFEPILLKKILHHQVLPFMIRLDRQAPHGYVRDWQVVSMPPARHRAYAFQWFSLACLVMVISLVSIFKKD